MPETPNPRLVAFSRRELELIEEGLQNLDGRRPAVDELLIEVSEELVRRGGAPLRAAGRP